MDYDVIFNEIGHFGRWQQINFFLGSLCIIGSSFICFMFTFIGFVPKFRCFVPECDGSSPADADYHGYFTNFTVPEVDDDDAIDGPQQCQQYIFRNISNRNVFEVYGNSNLDSCVEENFIHNVTKVCHDHVYDVSQYKYPLTAELDLSPCEGCSNYWDLEVSIGL